MNRVSLYQIIHYWVHIADRRSSSQRSHPSPPGPGTSGAGGRRRRVFQVVLEAQGIGAKDGKGMTQLTQCFVDEFRTGKSLQLAF